MQAFRNGRYWARTSDPQRVDTTAGFVAGSDSLTVFICTRQQVATERVFRRLAGVSGKADKLRLCPFQALNRHWKGGRLTSGDSTLAQVTLVSPYDQI
jgi:hypothetical protein